MEAELRIVKTKQIPNPHYYVRALLGEFKDWAFDEEAALHFKGKWRQEVFRQNPEVPFDLEIGTGNGFYFAHHANLHPERCYLGLEIKFKPLIQSIRRALNMGATNARMVRYKAEHLDHLFADQELNNIYIHFPDPWVKRRKNKRRLIQTEYLELLYRLQRPGSFVEFKTDSREYFDWAIERFKTSPYELVDVSYDLHNSQFAKYNFVTHFERIFLRQSIPINYCRLIKN